MTLDYRIDPRGALKIIAPPTSGNFEFVVACELHDNKGNKTRIYTGRMQITSEVIDGNDAYHEYRECVQAYWTKVWDTFQRLNEVLRHAPIAYPHFDPAPGIKEMSNLIDELQVMAKTVGVRVRGPVQ